MMAGKAEDHHHHHRRHLRALAARAVTDSLRAAAPTDADRAARFEDCVRSLEAEKAKMEVFRRELPISVHLVADGTYGPFSSSPEHELQLQLQPCSFISLRRAPHAVIEWLKEELAQHRRPAPAPAPELFAPASAALPAAPAAKRKAAAAAAEGGGAVKAEADANDKRSWMSSAQLWSCGGGHDGSTTTTSTTNGSAAAASKPANKVGERNRGKHEFSAKRDFLPICSRNLSSRVNS
jgi:hypothetical protein